MVDWYELDVMCTSPNEPGNLIFNFTNKTNETEALVWGLEPGTFCTVDITTHVGNQTGATTQKNVAWSTDETGTINSLPSTFQSVDTIVKHYISNTVEAGEMLWSALFHKAADEPSHISSITIQSIGYL